MVNLTATVEAVEMQSRMLTLKKADGTYTTFAVPAEYERFNGIKVGDTVTAAVTMPGGSSPAGTGQSD